MEKRLHKGTIIANELGKTGHGMELRITDNLNVFEYAFITSSTVKDDKGRIIADYRKKGLGFNYQKKFIGKNDGLWHSGYFYRAYDEKVYDFVENKVLEPTEIKKPAKKTAPKKTATKTVTITEKEYKALLKKANAKA